MTLPQETKSKIIAEARQYATDKEPNDDYVDNALCSYVDGATEWAGKAQPVIDAAEKVAKIFAHTGDSQACAICQLAKALQQWKDRKEATK
jgi:hypothetical protein